MALFRGIQEYIALDANNITLVFDSGNIVNISGNIFLYPPQGHPILYNCKGLNLELQKEILVHKALKEEVEKPSNGPAAQKHIQQQVCILRFPSNY